jgi:hypothetical protein
MFGSGHRWHHLRIAGHTSHFQQTATAARRIDSGPWRALADHRRSRD